MINSTLYNIIINILCYGHLHRNGKIYKNIFHINLCTYIYIYKYKSLFKESYRSKNNVNFFRLNIIYSAFRLDLQKLQTNLK